jgi:hypothetical protein
MTAAITATAVPPQGEIAKRLPAADFHDCHETAFAPRYNSVLERYLQVVAPVHRRIVPATPRQLKA